LIVSFINEDDWYQFTQAIRLAKLNLDPSSLRAINGIPNSSRIKEQFCLFGEISGERDAVSHPAHLINVHIKDNLLGVTVDQQSEPSGMAGGQHEDPINSFQEL
jgi:hypothetical protein